jgi:hypothetical protein
MRTFAIATVGLAMLFAIPAHATHGGADFIVHGTIGDKTISDSGDLGPCTPAPILDYAQGFIQYMIVIPAEIQNHGFALTSDNQAADFDISFYHYPDLIRNGRGCFPMGGRYTDGDEAGIVPAGTTRAVVIRFQIVPSFNGEQAFTFTVDA